MAKETTKATAEAMSSTIVSRAGGADTAVFSKMRYSLAWGMGPRRAWGMGLPRVPHKPAICCIDHNCATPLPLPPHRPEVVIGGSLTILINRLPATRLEDTIVEALEPPNKILAGCTTVLIGG